MNKKVLVIDDDPIIRNLFRFVLGPVGFTVEEIADATKALDKAREWQPDVILLNVMMPGMDGITLCRALRSDPATAHVPIIIISAHADATTIQESLQAGAHKYLTKPVTRDDLVVAIQAVLKK